MLSLAAPTRPGWVAGIQEHLPLILLDHAHCEKKAASTAVNLIFRYQHHLQLMRPLAALAREELEHFSMVLDVLAERGIPFGPQAPSTYARRLREVCRSSEPDRLLDTLLCCALIEARSCERMKLLSEELSDSGLRAFYAELLASEARHHRLYVELAETIHPRDLVQERLRVLAAHEAEVIASGPDEPRLHH